ncbi:sulfatase family protein [Tundrisphaera sp. TA3]|uniref:sulfatase family protein n=1 Tax=Tundrisphaera sp. TA3 TaxID=3435775 RepID=UPI003EBECFED
MMMPTLPLLAALIVGSPPAKPVQPNIVVILSDDLGPGDIGGGVAKTPNLDRMAREGTRFNRYYSAAPVCSPSRCGLLTGQFPARWKITTFLQTREGNRKAEQADFLDAKAPSLPRALKAAGYATAHVGKWHLGGGRDVVDPPKFAAYGYDVGFGTWESPEPHPDITTDNEWIWSDRDPVKRWERTRWMTDRTLDFLKAHPDRPCFVNLWLDDPHTPWVPSVDDQMLNARGKATGKGDTPARLKGVLVEMDRQIGRLLDAIRDRNDDRPTIVLFLSDNGPLPPFPEQKRTGGLRGSKLSLFEGGLRLPFFAWSPGLIPAGRSEEAVLAAVDLFPTLCRLADAPLPEGYVSDGEDMSPAFLGQPAPARTRPLFWEFGRNAEGFNYPGNKNNRSPNLAILDGRWKLLINADGTQRELYDITKDERETANLESENPGEASRLSEALLHWRKSMP